LAHVVRTLGLSEDPRPWTVGKARAVNSDSCLSWHSDWIYSAEQGWRARGDDVMGKVRQGAEAEKAPISASLEHGVKAGEVCRYVLLSSFGDSLRLGVKLQRVLSSRFMYLWPVRISRGAHQ
jgi:hypothetical protein